MGLARPSSAANVNHLPNPRAFAWHRLTLGQSGAFILMPSEGSAAVDIDKTIDRAAEERIWRDKPPVAKTSVVKTSVAKTWLKAIELTAGIEAAPSRLFSDVVETWAVRDPDRPALISATETFDY